jgi:hypothetical protein
MAFGRRPWKDVCQLGVVGEPCEELPESPDRGRQGLRPISASGFEFFNLSLGLGGPGLAELAGTFGRELTGEGQDRPARTIPICLADWRSQPTLAAPLQGLEGLVGEAGWRGRG